MSIIELERWKPSEADPSKREYAGQRTAAEVFEELKYRLESMGYLPDEYFLMDHHWENGREIPKDADIFCTTDYGGSEGVYLDVYLKWHEDGKPITRSFITGKTLGENGNDLDKMFLISSAITKAFHGDHATHARYMKIGGVEDDTGGRVVHLSQQEEKIIIEALVEQRERQEKAMSQTEQLLRRMTGSITAYMDTVGQRPMKISDYDKAVLAIRDGELSAFKDQYPKALKNHADELLIAAAERPGSVGRKMTLQLLLDWKQFTESAYRTACQKAVDIDDPEKVYLLLSDAECYVENLPRSFYGEIASYACLDHRFIARELVQRGVPERIAAAPPFLLEQFAMDGDYRTLSTLVEKGISGGDSSARALHMLTCQKRDQWMAESLLRKRMWVDVNSYSALYACIQNKAVNTAKLLLDGGMDFDQYLKWAQARQYGAPKEIYDALVEHWSELKAEMEEAPAQETGGMTFG
ncbi:ankyrin repeat domain-containing protein [Pseudoflavonifractor sp. 60]|uniref:ankyrin repeat domain-containing protein n=1 Tax=Pseudoflavonifractor sp. 60 TaxID=2304576 RepID=UPI00136D87FF|nr:ankyrin repeat domain-containing protein [Pseudoflavonifractor sp. 60]NBI65985.1 ankyrin repeat domain-containing protein [Pseudoflavonifractor sp. 60]